MSASPRPLATVIVPNWNGAHLIGPCLESLARQTYQPLEVIVADGGSTDDSASLIARAYPRVRLLRLDRNRGFAGNVNAGIRAARGDVILLLNNDARADESWVRACVEALARHPRAGSIACKVLFEDGRTINSAGDLLTRTGAPVQRGAGRLDGPEWDRLEPVFGAMGGAAAYRRALFEDVGLLDEEFFAYLEDVDLAFRAQLRGWTCLYVPEARVVHLGSATGGGTLASYYNGRNLVRLLVKDVPAPLLPRLLPGMLGFQVRRARAALLAWRGKEARATLRGQLDGLLGIPWCFGARHAVQARRTVPDGDVRALLVDGVRPTSVRASSASDGGSSPASVSGS